MLTAFTLCLAAQSLGSSIAPALALGERAERRDYVIRIPLPPRAPAIDLPPVEGPEDASRPLVVIDPGHGGHDPGASSADRTGPARLTESALTLALARGLRDELVRRGRVRVALTRDADRFLALEERSGIARRLGADLFISVHADAAADAGATGATIYTLAERASDREAARIAARENRADTINGVALGEQPDDVTAILLDLSRREMIERSETFAQVLLREAAGLLRFRQEPRKGAAFVVLKAPDVPSILFEAGYISNPADAVRLASVGGRDRFARAFAPAIEAYFARVR